MDLWGPLPSGEHVRVMVDEYSRCLEVEFVHSTSAAAVVPHVDKIFTTHGFPEQIKTDGGPPFNGIDTHQFQQYMKWAGIKHILVSPEDPEANGLAENFSRQESLAHVPHRKEELQTGTLQIPSSLQSHSPYIHWQSTIRNHVQSKNTHTSPSLSGASTWPTAASTAWQIEGHPKVLQRCQVQCQAAQHSHWGQGASAPERIINTKPLWPPSIPGHRDQRKPDHSPAGWQSTTSRCEDVQEGVSKPTTAIFQPKIPPGQTQRGS